MGLSVIVPYWNGKHLAEANLPSVMKAASFLKTEWEVIAVDDGFTDGLAQFLQERFPQVKAITRKRNEGFSAAMKTGIEAARYELLYLLNSDVRVEPQAFDAVLAAFNDPQVCAVSSVDANKTPFSVPVLTNRWGLLGVRYLAVPFPAAPMPILFATGGHSAYRASVFKELGGYDELFAPAYWEDTDFGVRAAVKGFKILLEPKSRVHHTPRGTMARKYRAHQIEALRASHRWYFTKRHSQKHGLRAWLALVFSHGLFACPPFSTLFKKQGLIASQAASSQAVIKKFSAPVVKRALGFPWRIVFISATGAMAGGGESSLLTLLKGLDKKQVHPVAVCPEEGPLTVALRSQGIHVEKIAAPSTVKGLCNGTVVRFARWLREQNCDLVHVNSAGRSLLLWGMAARLAGIPVIWHVRVATKEPLTDGLSAAIASRLIVTSQFVASRFTGARLRSKMVRVANPVDLEQFAATKQESLWLEKHKLRDMICVGTFGRFDAWKRFDLSLRAFALARKQQPKLRLILVGDGPERLRLEALAKQLGLSQSVLFIGWHHQLSEIMHAMDIVFHPTPKEHFGRIFIEAMASGKPVVAPNSGGASELVVREETGILTDKPTPKLFAQAIVRLANDPQLRARMGANAQTQAGVNYSSKYIAEQIQAIYAGLLA